MLMGYSKNEGSARVGQEGSARALRRRKSQSRKAKTLQNIDVSETAVRQGKVRWFQASSGGGFCKFLGLA